MKWAEQFLMARWQKKLDPHSVEFAHVQLGKHFAMTQEVWEVLICIWSGGLYAITLGRQ